MQLKEIIVQKYTNNINKHEIEFNLMINYWMHLLMDNGSCLIILEKKASCHISKDPHRCKTLRFREYWPTCYGGNILLLNLIKYFLYSYERHSSIIMVNNISKNFPNNNTNELSPRTKINLFKLRCCVCTLLSNILTLEFPKLN